VEIQDQRPWRVYRTLPTTALQHVNSTPVLRTQYCVALRTPPMGVGPVKCRANATDQRTRSWTGGCLLRGRRRCRICRALTTRLPPRARHPRKARFGAPVRRAPIRITSKRLAFKGSLGRAGTALCAFFDDQSRRSRQARTRDPRRPGTTRGWRVGASVSAAGRPVNCPSCGFINKTAARAVEAAAESSPIPRSL
jgi:hypothetical protein